MPNKDIQDDAKRLIPATYSDGVYVGYRDLRGVLSLASKLSQKNKHSFLVTINNGGTRDDDIIGFSAIRGCDNKLYPSYWTKNHTEDSRAEPDRLAILGNTPDLLLDPITKDSRSISKARRILRKIQKKYGNVSRFDYSFFPTESGGGMNCHSWIGALLAELRESGINTPNRVGFNGGCDVKSMEDFFSTIKK